MFWFFFKNTKIKPHQNLMNNKLYMYKKQKHIFSHFGASYLETDRATIPQINTNFYFVPRIIVLLFQKDWTMETIVSTDRP